MDIPQLTIDDLRAIAADHPLCVARELASGIVALAGIVATEATGTTHETAINGPIGRIFAAAAELRALGGRST